MRSDLIQLLLGSCVVLWMMIEWVAIWRDRPPVVWDPYEMRWRAKRGAGRWRR